MNKLVYVLVYEWANEDDNGAEILGVYTNKEKASQELENFVSNLEYLKINSQKLVIDHQKGEFLEAYESGFYAASHARVTIEPRVTEE